MDIELIPFEIPSAIENAVYLPDIHWESSYDLLLTKITDLFSAFGLIYKVFISPARNQSMAKSKKFFSYIRYYSKNAANLSLSYSGKLFVGGEQLKIFPLVHQKPFKYRALSPYQAEELMSFYFGFNFWSSQIISLEKAAIDPLHPNLIKFRCHLKVITKDGLCGEGIGSGSSDLGKLNSKEESYRTARRSAVYNAKVDAFSKFLIVQCNGKCLIEVNSIKAALEENEPLPLLKTVGEYSFDPTGDGGEWIEDDIPVT